MKRWYDHQQDWTRPEYESETPARTASITADVLVPLAQALISGALAGGAVVLLFAVFGWRGDFFNLWLGMTVIVATAAWLILLTDSRRLLWGFEKITGQDIDQDGEVGEPSAGRQTIDVVVHEGNHQRIIGADWLGLSDDQVIMLAADLTRGRSLAEGDLGKDSVIFPRGINQYRDVRGKLVEAGLIEMVNPAAPAQGYTVTRAGRAVFEKLSKDNAHARARTNG